MISTRISDLELIRVAKELPMGPRLLVELGQLINDPDTDAREVTALLCQDPALAARLIRMANSVVYARTTPAESIDQAVGSIGFTEIHRLIGALAAKQIAESNLACHGIDGNRFRLISLFTAVLMEELAQAAGESPRRCYTVGLLRSIGMLALELLSRQGAPVTPYDPATGQTKDEWETAQWGLGNCEAAEVILREWRLPHETVIAIRHHYRPAGRHNPVIHLLTLAAGSAADRFQGIRGEEAYWKPTEENFRKAGINQLGFQQASERAQRTFQRLQATLD